MVILADTLLAGKHIERESAINEGETRKTSPHDVNRSSDKTLNLGLIVRSSHHRHLLCPHSMINSCYIEAC